MARRCRGITRAGKPCSITTSSQLTNDSGRLAAEPLKRGGEYCLFHAKPFCANLCECSGKDCVLVLLDTETTGVDISRDRIVEIAAVHCPVDARFFGGSFSTVVCTDPTILVERGAAAAAVHGIPENEIAAGPKFPEAWRRFLFWVESLLNNAVADADDSEDDDVQSTRLRPDAPTLLLAGHNAFKFDFPLLLCECLRHGISCDGFQQWLFADTLQVVQASARGCLKLQCLVKLLGDPADLRAHRALDDCVALRHVGVALAEQLDTDLPSLLKRFFAFEIDLRSSLVQLSVLMDI